MVYQQSITDIQLIQTYKIMNKNYLVYDIEVYKNLIYILIYKKSKIYLSIEFSNRKAEFKKFFKFFKEHKKENIYFVGFNNSHYDYPILYSILNYILKHKFNSNVDDLLFYVYNISKNIVEKNKTYNYPELLNQIDLRLIHHFNNKNKRHISLKVLEFNMMIDSIEELPIDPHKELTDEEIELIINYCHNDVKATEKFFNISKSKIEFRHKMSKKYNIDLVNKNDVDIGGEILLDNLSESLGTNKKTIESWRTFREEMKMSDIILPYVSFKSKEFNALLNWWKPKVLHSTKGQFTKLSRSYVEDILPYTDNDFTSDDKLRSLNIIYAENKFVFGTGGLHSVKSSGVWKADKDYFVSLLDVSSYYPNLASKNKFHPEHIPKEIFKSVIDTMYNQRMQAKKDGDYESVAAIKLALNGFLYGCFYLN